MLLAKHKIKWATMNPGETLPTPRTTRRFETTSLSGTESVASRRGEVPDRATMIRELEMRKLNNTKTSVSFGSTKTVYESDAMRRQKDILRAPPREKDEQKLNMELKQALTSTHFTLGDEPVAYQRASTLADPTGHLNDYTGVLNSEVKGMIKTSNLFFGDTTTVYRSVATDQMDLRVPEGENIRLQREKNRLLKVALSRTTFKLGEDKNEWVTDHQMGFQYDPVQVKTAWNQKIAKETKARFSRTHINMGNHECDWQTDAMRTQACSSKAMTPDERRGQAEMNIWLKKELQSTHYQIGTDEDYM
ncbi:unnamed protein product [Ascophyllum nodosum]